MDESVQKIKKQSANLVPFMLLVTPLLDWINGFAQFYFGMNSFILVVFLRAIICLWLMIDSFKYIRTAKFSFILILLYVLQLFVMSLITQNVSKYLFLTFTQFSKFLYFIEAIFYVENHSEISEKLMKKSFIVSMFFITVTLLIQKIFGIGLSTYSGNQSLGFTGFFGEQNALSNVLVGTMPLLFYFFRKSKSKLIIILLIVISVAASVLIGTKTGMFGIAVILLITFLTSKIQLRYKLILVALVVLFIPTISNFFSDGAGASLIERQLYFYNLQDISTYITSGRNHLAQNLVDTVNSTPFGVGWLVGIGSYLSQRGSEMDWSDIACSFGVISACLVFFLIFRKLKNITKIPREKALSYLTFIVLGLIGGHVLLSPLASIFFVFSYYEILVDERKNNPSLNYKD